MYGKVNCGVLLVQHQSSSCYALLAPSIEMGRGARYAGGGWASATDPEEIAAALTRVCDAVSSADVLFLLGVLADAAPLLEAAARITAGA